MLSRRGRSAGIDAVAVLPFENASRDPNLEYLSDGLAEELINSLAQASRLRVIARPTAFTYKGRPVDPRTIGQQLHVQAVLTGRVTQQAGRITVQADLVNCSDGSQLWGQQYNRSATELEAVQEEIASQIAGRLRVQLSGDKGQLKKRAANPQAYDAYLKGRQALSGASEDRIRQSAAYFEQTVALDPNYAAAYAGLADSYFYLELLEAASPQEVMPKAKNAAFKALDLDGASSEAHTSLASIMLLYELNWLGARQHFLRALELNSGSNNAYERHWYAHYLETEGRWSEALSNMQKALDLDPMDSMIAKDLGYDLYYNRRSDRAVQQLRQAAKMDNEDADVHSFLTLALEAKGQRAESLAEADYAYRYAFHENYVAAYLGGIYIRNGRPEKDRKVLGEIEAASGKQYVSPLGAAAIYFALGDKEQGLRLLERACQERSMNLVFMLSENPSLDLVRRDRRFIALMERTGVPKGAYWVMSPVAK